MADKDWKKRLEAIGNSPMDETSQRIMAGIEASKKRNAELAKDVDKRRAEYEAKQKAAKTPQKAAKTQQTTAETRPKRSTPVPTKVRSSKGGAMTAEVDDAAVKRQKAPSKAAEQKKSQSTSSGEGKITPKKPSNSNVKYKNEPVIKTSEKKPEESVSSIMRNYGRNPKGVRDSQKKLAKGILLAPLRFLNKRTEAQEKKKKGSRHGSPYQLRIK